MEKDKLKEFQARLEAQKDQILEELKGIAVQDPDNPDNWNVKNPEMNDREADPNKLGDNLEEEGVNDAITDSMETQLKEVTDALQRIEDGSYGKCEVNGEDIDLDRLEANPSARTCKDHMDK